jgi:hypothetical protein
MKFEVLRAVPYGFESSSLLRATGVLQDCSFLEWLTLKMAHSCPKYQEPVAQRHCVAP